jgi:hypothetical protein
MPDNKYKTVVLFLLVISLSVLMPGKIESKLQASFHVDYFSPQQDIYRELYGSANFPLHVRLEYRFTKGISIFSGIRYLNSTGETKTSSTAIFDETYTSQLTIISIPLGINWYLGSNKMNPFIGCGGYYHSYSESWQGTDMEYSGTKFAFFAQGGMQLKIGARLSLLLLLSYTTLPTGIDTMHANGINLGGTAAGFGFAYSL